MTAEGDGLTERERLERAIAAQEGLRDTIGDDAVDLAVSALRERLASLREPEQRRRQATVLFADVSGFTPMAETLDAEIVTGVMNDLWSRIDAVLTEHGARIDKHMGDAVMALWGSDAAHEGDPERAINAALAVQRVVSEHATASGHDLHMRVGITTGPVVFGAVGSTREFTAMGDTVNVAARLESAAPIGGVLISHDTYRHVRGVFDATALEPLRVRGKSEPVQVYIVHRAKPHTFRMPTRGVEGVETRMIGRDRELEALREAYRRVTRERSPHVVTVVGDAGVGKSRLLYEFENWLDLLPEPVHFLKARALEIRQTLPFGVFRDLVASRFGIRESDERAVVAARLVAGFAPALPPDRALQVGQWIGFALPEDETPRPLEASADHATIRAALLADHFRAVAADQTVCIVVEDLHWGDDDSIDLLERLVMLLDGHPVLLIAAARPSLAQRRPDWPRTRGRDEVVLDALSDFACRALVDEVLQRLDTVPDELTQLLTDRADGNPYFVEELVKMLIDDGVIVADRDAAPWSVDLDALDAIGVPTTLTGVLEARLDGLPLGPRRAVQRASVVGRVFWDEVVATMAEEQDADTTSDLAVATARELVYRRHQSTLEDTDEYIFKHALLRDVVYETVLLRDRRALHLIAAEWLADHAGARSGELAEMIAEHYRLGGRTADAAQLHLEAGARSLLAGRSVAAYRSTERAIALWREIGSDPSWTASIQLARAALRLGRADDGHAALAPLEHADLDDETRADVLYHLSWVASERGERETERDLLERALPIAEIVGGDVLVRVLMGLTWVAANADDADQAERHAMRALAVAESLPEASAELDLVLSAIAMVKDLRGRIDEAETWIQRSLAVARATGNLEGEARALGNLGVVHHLRGDADGSPDHYELAAHYYREQLSLEARLGVWSAHASALLNLAQVQVRQDRPSEARTTFARAVDESLAAESASLLHYCLIVGADLFASTGNVERALSLLRSAYAPDGIAFHHRRDADHVVERMRSAGVDETTIAAGLAPSGGAVTSLDAVVRELAEQLARA